MLSFYTMFMLCSCCIYTLLYTVPLLSTLYCIYVVYLVKLSEIN